MHALGVCNYSTVYACRVLPDMVGGSGGSYQRHVDVLE